MAIKIEISKDFTTAPGFRYYSDGPYSGQEFFDKILKPKFEEAIEKGETVEINLNGVEGYTSSFINESFRRLAEVFGPDIIWNNLSLITNEIPKLKEKIKEALYEKHN